MTSVKSLGVTSCLCRSSRNLFVFEVSILFVQQIEIGLSRLSRLLCRRHGGFCDREIGFGWHLLRKSVEVISGLGSRIALYARGVRLGRPVGYNVLEIVYYIQYFGCQVS